MLQMLQADPTGFNKEEIYRLALQVLGVQQPEKYLAPPQTGPQQPSPQDVAARAKMIEAQTKAQTEPAKLQQKAAEVAARAGQTKAEQDVANTNLAKELVIHGSDRQKAQGDLALRAADHHLDLRKHALDASVAAHDAAMDVANLQHEKQKSDQEHALGVAEANKPESST